ncbi:MAG: hypothetical protein ABI678_14420 [Kofleriaceae bacterium]
MTSGTKTERSHPPLARDLLGNLLPIPANTAAWRICRETSGRPSELKGPDKQLIRFPLDTTSEDVVELCGPGMYRVYALDDLGKQLAHVSSLDLTVGAREPRNGAIESPLTALRPGASPNGTDLRFALEAMTHMMRTHVDALRIVAESHVDLAKAVVSAKGLPRNAMQLLPAPQPKDDSDDDDDDDNDDAAAEDRQPHWVELLMPLAQKAAEIVPGLVIGNVAQRSTRHTETSEAGAMHDDAELANRPKWEARDLVDLKYAARKGEAKRAARDRPSSSATGIGIGALQARVMADPALVEHLFAIKAQLEPHETDALMGAIAGSSDEERSKVIEHIKSLRLEESVEFCRELVHAIREHSHPEQAE